MRVRSSIIRARLPSALQALRAGGLAAGVLCVVGCGTPGVVGGAPGGGRTAPSLAASPERAHIEAVYRSHCGSCHAPVAPGSEPPDRLEAELERHHKRTRLTEAEWVGLDAFLTRR